MDLQDTILTILSKYPDLCQRPDQVLDDLYLCIGNGYKWVGGRLVSRDNPLEPVNTVFITWEEEVQAIHKYYEEALSMYGDSSFSVERAIEKLIHGRIRPFVTYPISKNYSACCNVPDNVKIDWLAGAHYILDCILDDTFFNVENLKTSKNYQDRTKREAHLRSQKFEAQEAKFELQLRFEDEIWQNAYQELKQFIERVEKHKQIAKFRKEWAVTESKVTKIGD